MPLRKIMKRYQERVETALEERLPSAQTLPTRLHEAMRYAVLDGGKRVRPILVYATGEIFGTPLERLDGPACAVELIHAYSLVHDDMPAMDDDELRRGKPTVHKAYDEATALLVGDALQTLAFHLLAHEPPHPSAAARLKMIEALALASGSRGMAGGQAIDLGAVGRQLNIAELEDMHIHKTGALIRASVTLGALAAGVEEGERLERLDHYAKCIGLAFQIRDDILDVEGDTAILGKPQGSDQSRDKPTYPALLGLDGARERARALHRDALASLEPFGEEAETLRLISRFIVERVN